MFQATFLATWGGAYCIKSVIMHFKSIFSQKLEKAAKLLRTICKTSFLCIQQGSKYVVRRMTLPLETRTMTQNLSQACGKVWYQKLTKTTPRRGSPGGVYVNEIYQCKNLGGKEGRECLWRTSGSWYNMQL